MIHIDVLLVFRITVDNQTMTVMTDGLDIDNDVDVDTKEVERAIVQLPGIAGYSFIKRKTNRSP
ncbi:MAG: hypothetical protein WCG99_02570 [Candidatus Berkelbacteria bacterium]